MRRLASVWGLCFEALDGRAIYTLVQPLRRRWNLLLGRGFVRWLTALSPDVVVATHFLPADLCGAGKRAGWLRAALVVVVTDLHAHRFWLAPEAEAVVVAMPETAAECARRGVPRDRLHVLGIPIARDFQVTVDRPGLQRRLGLEAARKTVLVTSGGNTVGPFEAVVEALLSLPPPLPDRLQLLVVCGDDAAAARRLEARARRSTMPVRVFGFVENMPDLMGAADLVVAKAGGMTVAESLARRLPLVLYHAIPGQERFNARYVARHGAAVIAPTPTAVAQAVARYVEDPVSFEGMRRAAAALSHPNAAGAIVSQVLRPLCA